MEELNSKQVIEDIRRREIVSKFVALENKGIIGIGEIVKEMRKENIVRPNGKIMSYEYLNPTTKTKWFIELKRGLLNGRA